MSVPCLSEEKNAAVQKSERRKNKKRLSVKSAAFGNKFCNLPYKTVLYLPQKYRDDLHLPYLPYSVLWTTTETAWSVASSGMENRMITHLV